MPNRACRLPRRQRATLPQARLPRTRSPGTNYSTDPTADFDYNKITQTSDRFDPDRRSVECTTTAGRKPSAVYATAPTQGSG